MRQFFTKRRLWAGAAVVAAIAIGGVMFSGQFGHYSGGHHHGVAGHEHDMENMPGLKGEDASERESDELAVMFRRFEDITRTVENLPNGIRTTTFSADDEVMAVITSHIVGMVQRVDEKRDPKIIIQSPTLDTIFQRAEAITTEINMTDQGIEVVQTSDDPEVVAALQTHAGEVSGMVDRGMEAVHEQMAKRSQ